MGIEATPGAASVTLHPPAGCVPFFLPRQQARGAVRRSGATSGAAGGGHVSPASVPATAAPRRTLRVWTRTRPSSAGSPESQGPLTDHPSGATRAGDNEAALARIGKIPYALDPAQRESDAEHRARATAIRDEYRKLATDAADAAVKAAGLGS